jgi:Bacterial membrane protein YfhO
MPTVEPTSQRSRRELLRAALLLVLMVAVFFPDVVFLGRTVLTSPLVSPAMGQGRPPYGYQGAPRQFDPYILDPLASAAGHEPLFKKIHSFLRSSQLPLWNADSGLGRPLLGSSSPLDSPLRLPLMLWPTPSMWDTFLLARLVIAGLFAYLLARRLRLGPVGALGAGLAYPFTGYFMLRINMGHVDFAALLPVILYAMELLVEARTPRRVAFAAITLSLGILSDNPEAGVILLFFAASYFAARAVRQAKGGIVERIRAVSPIVPTLAIGLALTAVTTVSFLRLTGYLGGEPLIRNVHLRAQGLGPKADELPRAITFLLPFVRGAPLRGFHGGFTQVRDYTGVVMPVLGLIGLGNRAFLRRAGWFFAGALLVAIAKLYGIPPINWVGRIPPLDKILFYRYLPPVATLSLAMLAAAGIDRVARGRVRMWQPIVSAGAVLALVFLAVGSLRRGWLAAVPGDHLWAQLGFAAILLAMVGVAVAANGLGRFRGGGLALIVLMGVELFVLSLPTKGNLEGLARVFYPNHRMAIVERPARVDGLTEPPFVAFLKRDPTVFRVYGLDNILRGNATAAFGLQGVLELNPVRVSRSTDFMKRALLRPTGDIPPGQPLTRGGRAIYVVGNPMFDLMNVKYVLTGAVDLASLAPDQYELVYDRDVKIYRNRAALPRAFVVHEAHAVSNREAAIRFLLSTAIDPSRSAVVEGTLPPAQQAFLRPSEGGGASDVRIRLYRDDRVELQVRTERPGLLVLTDTYYPGWKATVDGVSVPILATDEAFRSVFVPAGVHDVTFVFRPRTFCTGAAITFLGALALVGYAVWDARRRRLEAKGVRRERDGRREAVGPRRACADAGLQT